MGADDISETKELELARVPVLGREADLEVIARSDAAVVLITGDSGIGKSTLLRLAQETAPTVAAPPPITLAAAPGSLQRALLQGLADATAAVMHEHGQAKAIGDRLSNAARRLAEEKGIELAKVLGRAVLLKAKEELGAEAVDLVIEYTQELGKAGDEALLARIVASADPSTTDVLIGFAEELVQIAGDGVPIILALDAGELLHEDDRRLLCDLANRLPDGFQLRVAFGTWNEELLSHAEEIVVSSSAISGHQLSSLPVAAIAEWLGLNGLSQELAEEVSRKTGGYPLFIEDAVADLSGGGTVAGVSGRELFIGRTHQTWRSLDPQAQAVARQLVVFDSPLPEGALMEVCDLTPAEWGGAVDRLQRAGVLSGTVNGVPWFHPQRQEVLRGYLRDHERAQLEDAAAAAITAYMGYAETGRALELTANVAQLAATSTRLREQLPGVGIATDLDRDELAVLAALIELSERAGPLVNAAQVLLHARDFFSATGDLVEALQSLLSSGLVRSISVPRGVLLQPALGDPTTQAVVQGRALLELGRPPLPGLVSSAFAGVIRPRVEPFVAAGFGVSSESLRHSLGEIQKLFTVGGGPYWDVAEVTSSSSGLGFTAGRSPPPFASPAPPTAMPLDRGSRG
jgi:AAA ATPase domain